MEAMRPMPGAKDLDAFALKTLRTQLPGLVQLYSKVPLDTQRQFAGDFRAVVSAAKKYQQNAMDCPLGPRDLVRVTMALKVKIERHEEAKELLHKPSAAPKPTLLAPKANTEEGQRKRARGSAGPHPVVSAAKRQKREADAAAAAFRAEIGDSDSDSGGDEDSAFEDGDGGPMGSSDDAFDE